MYKAKSGVRRRGRAFTEHKLADAALILMAGCPMHSFPHPPIEREREDGAGRRPARRAAGGFVSTERASDTPCAAANESIRVPRSRPVRG